MNKFYYHSPLGYINIAIDSEVICELSLDNQCCVGSDLTAATDQTARELCHQLNRYFSDSHMKFTVPVQAKGTAFQHSVWKAMCTIPVGSTMSYGELAAALKTSARAVGNACRKNPVPLLIPCHRVVAKSGLGGYSGETSGERITIKKWLLNHEGVNV